MIHMHISLTDTTLNHLAITTKGNHTYDFHYIINQNSRIFQQSKTCLVKCSYYSRDQKGNHQYSPNAHHFGLPTEII